MNNKIKLFNKIKYNPNKDKMKNSRNNHNNKNNNKINLN